MHADLRSDTITRPTPQMLDAMMQAKVGDDVFGEDPTINELQEFASALFGKEAALFCSSGTLTNQIAINLHTRPGDEVICSDLAHVYLYEGGGIARNSGCSVRLLSGDRGRINAEDVHDAVNRRQDAHLAWTSLVCLEDTVNKGGGSIYDPNEILRIRKVCDAHGLKLHLDGARVFNALVEKEMNWKAYAAPFDTISICLSKGLGAPVGSLLLGDAASIAKARRVRKVMGGGMRQAGFLAAAGIYALKHHIDRLKEDHANARTIGQYLNELAWVEEVLPIETNIVIAKIREPRTAEQAVRHLMSNGIHCFAFGKDKIRMVTHLDFGKEQMAWFEENIRSEWKD
jgi:threonine aldolase